jgi:hypothetical protein
LKSQKQEIIKNVLADAPEIQARAFGGNKVQQAYVSSGFIDGVTFSCTDINQVMAASKVNWNFGVMSRDEFLDCVETCTAEMFKTGRVSEETYDNLDFPKDSDVRGNIYELTDSRDVLARSMPIFSPEGMRRKQQQAVDDFRRKEDEWQKSQRRAEPIIFCTQKTLDVMMKVTAGCNLASISFADLNKFKLEELANFVNCRQRNKSPIQSQDGWVFHKGKSNCSVSRKTLSSSFVKRMYRRSSYCNRSWYSCSCNAYRNPPHSNC